MKLTSRELQQFEREQDDYDQLLTTIRHPPAPWGSDRLEITCIGNTGGGLSVLRGRPCGGFLLRHAGRTIIVDPGDNVIAYLTNYGFNPFDLTDVLASHAHNDHVGDLSLAISAAINLNLPEECDGHVIVAPSLIDYSNASSTQFGFTLPAYSWLADVQPLYIKDIETKRFDGKVIRAKQEMQISPDIKVRATEARHGQVLVTGFVIETEMGRIGYTSDTEYFDGLSDWYRDVDLLWMNMNTLSLDAVVPADRDPAHYEEPVHNHLGYVGVCRLIDEVRPKTAIVSHLGSQIERRRAAIEELLRQRFAPQGVTVFCPGSGDSYVFKSALSKPPFQQRFQPWPS